MSSMYPDVMCPYCEHMFDIDDSEPCYYQEERPIITTCPECGDEFNIVCSMSWSYSGERMESAPTNPA